VIGTIAVVDFRILGFGLMNRDSVQLQRDLFWWTVGALTVAVFSGLLLFSTDPDMYYLNPSFLIKILLLLVAICWQFTMRLRAAANGETDGGARLTAAVSLLLWALVIFGGIFIAFVDQVTWFGGSD